MKKLLTGALLLSAMATGAHAAEETDGRWFNPVGSVEVGSEWEEYTSSNNQANKDFLLPYIKTNTRVNKNSEWAYDLNYTYRRHTTSNQRDRRERLEFFVHTPKYKNGNYVLSPRVGFRHEMYGAGVFGDDNRKRTYYRFYTNQAYKLNDTMALFTSGWFAYVDDNKDGGDTKYKHEQEFGIKVKHGAHQMTYSGYSDYETYGSTTPEDGKEDYSRESTNELQFRIRHDYNWANGKTKTYEFARIGIFRVDEYENGKDDNKRERNRFGVGIQHKIHPDFTIVSEVYYESAPNGQNYNDDNDGPNHLGSDKEDTNKMFVKLGLKYSY